LFGAKKPSLTKPSPPFVGIANSCSSRALLRGKMSLKHASSGGKDVLKSIIAMPAYALALPILLVVGQHAFMKYLVKAFDHAGRLMAFIGLDPVKEKYVTE